jgi:hypothetical protein
MATARRRKDCVEHYGFVWEPPYVPDDGPWMSEPHQVHWVDPYSNYDCVVKRHPRFGNLNGYVGVNNLHWLHGVEYTEIDRYEPIEEDPYAHLQIYVHGGLTHTGGMPPYGEPLITFPNRASVDTLWWFGFDTAHAGDFMPGMQAMLDSLEGMPTPPTNSPCPDIYKPLSYVMEQCRELARKLKDLER